MESRNEISISYETTQAALDDSLYKTHCETKDTDTPSQLLLAGTGPLSSPRGQPARHRRSSRNQTTTHLTIHPTNDQRRTRNRTIRPRRWRKTASEGILPHRSGKKRGIVEAREGRADR